MPTTINIFIVGGGELREARKRLRSTLPAQVQESLHQSGREVELESGEELRDKLPEGFPRKFIVPEQVLFFPDEEGESNTTKKRRRQMKNLNNRLRRKKTAGNTEA